MDDQIQCNRLHANILASLARSRSVDAYSYNSIQRTIDFCQVDDWIVAVGLFACEDSVVSVIRSVVFILGVWVFSKGLVSLFSVVVVGLHHTHLVGDFVAEEELSSEGLFTAGDAPIIRYTCINECLEVEVRSAASVESTENSLEFDNTLVIRLGYSSQVRIVTCGIIHLPFRWHIEGEVLEA